MKKLNAKTNNKLVNKKKERTKQKKDYIGEMLYKKYKHDIDEYRLKSPSEGKVILSTCGGVFSHEFGSTKLKRLA